MHQHEPIHILLSKNQIHKIKRGEQIQIPHHNISHHQGFKFTKLHPENLAKLRKAYHHKKGVRLHLAHHELEGTGLWDDIKAVFNKYVKPVLSTVGDTVANALSYTNPELAPVIQGIRGGIKNVTGVGLHNKKASKRVISFNDQVDLEHVPTHFPGMPVEKGSGMHHKKRGRKKKGSGIVPPGY